jgi:hypothetical protein
MAETTGTIRLHIVDGTRQAIASSTKLLLRVLDGTKQQVISRWVSGSTIEIPDLPIRDNFYDLYTVFVHADGYCDAGLYPVIPRASRTLDAYAMLLPQAGTFRFPPIAAIQADSLLYGLIANGVSNPANRYQDAINNTPIPLGALLTIGTVIRDLPLDDSSSPLKYYWETIWDLLAPDRFWAWVDVGLAGRIAALASIHSMAEEDDAAGFHPRIPGRVQPATRSWKQVRFDVSNLQLTFHENDKQTCRKPDGSPVECVIVEPDIDYYKDLGAHGLLEVLPNALENKKTDPRQDYSLRWMATKLEGVQPDFAPPITIV